MLDTRIVEGEGAFDAKLWLVGEAPGADEDFKGKPFVGSAGRMLDVLLKNALIPRTICRVDNCFQQRPPANDVGYFFLDVAQTALTEEGKKHIERLRADLRQSRPNLVVALGATALWILADKKGISKWRGSVLPSTLVPGLKVLATYHPSFVMRLMQERGQEEGKVENVFPIVVRDLKRASKECLSHKLDRPVRQTVVLDDAPRAIAWLESVPSGAEVAFDIENIPHTGILTRLGLCWEEKGQVTATICFTQRSRLSFGSQDLWRVLVAIDRLFKRPDVRKIWHNGLYDLAVLGHAFGLRMDSWKSLEDTMILHHAIYPTMPKSLAFLTSIYTKEPFYKDATKGWEGSVPDEVLSNYNAKDCAVTREIFPLLCAEAKREGHWDSYRRSMSYMPSLLAMGLRGIKVNTTKRAQLETELDNRLQGLFNSLKEKTGGREWKISTSSTKDLQELLYDHCGFAPLRTALGKLSTDDDALAQLQANHISSPIPPLVREIRKLLKLKTTYLGMELSADGRMRTSYDPSGTVTWRLSSRQSVLGGGGNLQTIPKRTKEGKAIRGIFVADEGRVLVGADLVQAEAMVVAWLAQEAGEMGAFLAGEDIHWVNAKDIFGLEPGLARDPNDPDHTRMREIGKTAKHAGNYGMGPRKLSALLRDSGHVVSYAYAQELLDVIRRKRPGIEAWKREVEKVMNSSRTLVTPWGRRRTFLGRPGPDLHRKMLAQVPQSTIGELLCMAIRDIYQHVEVEQGLVEVLLNIHDEVIVQTPKGQEQEAIKQMHPWLLRPMTIHGKDLTVPVKFSIGTSLASMQEEAD